MPTITLFACGMGAAHGATLYWDTNGTTPGFGTASGTWGTSADWSASSAGTATTTGTLPTNADDVIFSNSATGTVTIGGTENAHSISFGSSVAITLSGGTSIDLGSAASGSGIFATGTGSDTVSTAITLDPSATGVSFSNTSTGTLTISGSVTGNTTSGTQLLTLATSSTGGVVVSGNITDGAAGGNVGVNVNAAAGLVTLSGANNYTGPTTIAAGTLLFAKEVSLYNDNTANWTAANIAVASGGTAAFSVGGAGEFTTTDITTLLGNLSTVNGNGLQAGSSIGFSTTNASGGSFTVSNNIGDSTGTGGGSIGLTKLGTGTLVLSGTNTYSGATTISSGTLLFNKEASLYNHNTSNWTAAMLTVNSGATAAFSVGGTGEFTTSDVTTLLGNLLTVNNNGLKSGASIGFNVDNGVNFTISDNIGNSTGAGGGSLGLTIVAAGTGTLTLSGANTYTGGTTVNGGTLSVSNDQSLANGGWQVGSTGQSNTTNVNFNAGSTIAIPSGKSISIFGNTSAGNPSTVTVAGTVLNSGTLNINKFGTLTLGSGANWTQSGSSFNLTPNPQTYASAALNVNAGATFTYTGTTAISVNPSSGSTGSGGNATLTVAGGTFRTGQGFSDTIGSPVSPNITGSANLILSNGGTLQLSANIATLATTSGSPFNVSLGTNGGAIDTNGFSTKITQNIANVSSQTGSLTKAGNGELTLSGASTYTGSTSVNGGTLVVSGSLSGTANVIVGPSGTLASGATGSITTAAAGNISVSGKLAPGDLGSVGTLTLAPGTGGQLSFASGSTLALDISGASSDQVAFSSSGDWLLGSGNVTLSLSGLTAGNYSSTYTIFSNVTTSGFQFASITGYDTADYLAKVTQVGTNYQLSFAAVPEPASAVSLLGGLGVLVGIRRRRR